jgi:ADP-ribose pyrophosphatase
MADDVTVMRKTKWLDFVKRGTWAYVTRPNASGVIGIIAVTDEKRLVLVEQYRPPVNTNVIELPAGLVGDIDAGESLATGAKRELLEETGFKASRVKKLASGVSSAGLADEVITLFYATGLKRVPNPPKDADEHITLHLVPLAEVGAFLEKQRRRGKQIDLKIYSALHFIAEETRR